jgi:hypothetical protein
MEENEVVKEATPIEKPIVLYPKPQPKVEVPNSSSSSKQIIGIKDSKNPSGISEPTKQSLGKAQTKEEVVEEATPIEKPKSQKSEISKGLETKSQSEEKVEEIKKDTKPKKKNKYGLIAFLILFVIYSIYKGWIGLS